MDPIKAGARQAVINCVKVARSDRVVIITDEETKKLGRALENEVRAIGAELQFFVMEDFGKRPTDGNNPLKLPSEIKDALENATASFFIAQGKKGELQTFRMPMLKIIDEKGIRHGHMIGFSEEMMSQGMAADYAQIQALSARVHEIVKSAKEIRVTTKAGTDITAKFSPNIKWIVCDGNIKPHHWSNLPDGEVFTCPATINGLVVVDGCLGDFFCEKYGDIKKTPITYKLEDGRAVKSSVRCSNVELKNEFIAYVFETDENSDRIGEFALGTNTALTKLIGNMLQDEKFPGVHLALGDPYSDKTGATWSSKAHLDGVLRNCTIYVDGRKIMEDSKYLI